MFLCLVLTVIAAGLQGCVTSPPLDLPAVSARSHPPSIVRQTIARFDIKGPRAFTPPDRAMVGHWINRVGYIQSEHLMIRIYKSDGTWTADDGSGDFLTLQADGLRWLYEVARYPDGGVSGRSLRIYAIDGDQMLARFQNRHTGWEFWERSQDNRLTNASSQ